MHRSVFWPFFSPRRAWEHRTETFHHECGKCLRLLHGVETWHPRKDESVPNGRTCGASSEPNHSRESAAGCLQQSTRDRLHSFLVLPFPPLVLVSLRAVVNFCIVHLNPRICRLACRQSECRCMGIARGTLPGYFVSYEMSQKFRLPGRRSVKGREQTSRYPVMGTHSCTEEGNIPI